MDSELILSAQTFRAGNIEINNSFSGVSDFSAVSMRLRLATAGYVFTSEDYLVVGMNTINYFLPTLTERGRLMLMKNNSGGVINLHTSGGESFDGVASPYILNDKECLTVIGDAGTGTWYIVDKKV